MVIIWKCHMCKKEINSHDDQRMCLDQNPENDEQEPMICQKCGVYLTDFIRLFYHTGEKSWKRVIYEHWGTFKKLVIHWYRISRRTPPKISEKWEFTSWRIPQD